MSRKLALVVGNTTYTDPRFSTLSTPRGDVQHLVELLRDPSIGAFDEVEPLVNQTESVVSRTIDRFFTGKMRDDLLLLYFSGHGMLDEEGQLYLALTDTEWEAPRSSAVSAAFVAQAMDSSRSNRVVLILDCCHSGAFARGAKGVIGASVGTKTAFEGNGYGRCVLTATDATQYAWEGQHLVGEESQQNAGTSVFTHFLVEGLQNGEADTDRDGQITVRELKDYIHDRVIRQKLNQTPSMWSYKEQGNLVVATNPRPALPAELEDAIRNPYPEVRKGAVKALAQLAAGQHTAVGLLAIKALQQLEKDDSRRVAQLATLMVQTIESGGDVLAALISARHDALKKKLDGTQETEEERPQPTQQTRTGPAKTREWIAQAERRVRNGAAAAGRYFLDSARRFERVLAQGVEGAQNRPRVLQAVATSAAVLLVASVIYFEWGHNPKQTATPSSGTVIQTDAGPAVRTAVPNAAPPTPANAVSEQASSGKAAETPGNASTPPPDLPQAAAGPIQVAQAVLASSLISKAVPTYPPLARSARVQGTVVLSALIDREGRVGEVTAKKGHPMLIPAAIDAVRKWRYKPYLLEGKPTPVATEISVRFHLLNDAPAKVPAMAKAVGNAVSVGKPAPAAEIQTHSAETGVALPRVLHSVIPEYTEQARQARLQGTVLLAAVIEDDGRVGDVHVLHSLGMGLDERAIESLRQSKFVPATKNGKPVRLQIKINVNFILQ